MADYSSKLSNYGLVFKYIKKYYYLLHVSFLLVVLSTIGFLIASFIKKYIYISVILLAISYIIVFIAFVKFNVEAKEVLRKKYDIIPKGFMWNDKEYFDYSDLQFKNYLRRKGWLNSDKINIIISLLEKEGPSRKISGLFIPGLLLALTLPLWDKVLDYVYMSLADTKEVIVLTLILFFVIAILAFVFSLVYKTCKEFIDDILNRESKTMDQVARKLKYILLEIPGKK